VRKWGGAEGVAAQIEGEWEVGCASAAAARQLLARLAAMPGGCFNTALLELAALVCASASAGCAVALGRSSSSFSSRLSTIFCPRCPAAAVCCVLCAHCVAHCRVRTSTRLWLWLWPLCRAGVGTFQHCSTVPQETLVPKCCSKC
jgi:hypothetical protein